MRQVNQAHGYLCTATTAQLVQMLQDVPLFMILCRYPSCEPLDLLVVDSVPVTGQAAM